MLGEGLSIRVPKPLPDYSQRLMDTLGVRVIIDPAAPAECPCGCKHSEKHISLRTGTWK